MLAGGGNAAAFMEIKTEEYWTLQHNHRERDHGMFWGAIHYLLD